jgi:hypothetical protein
MKKRRVRPPSAAMVVACIALIVAASGTAVAAQQMVTGDTLIKPRSLSGDRLRNHTLTGKQLNLRKLGRVPSATRATSATSATTAGYATSAGTANSATSATSAASAADAAQLGGSPPAAFQSRVSATCTAGSGIQQVNADGTVGCGPVSIYSGRIVTALNAQPTTVLTIPGVAHVVSLNCQSNNANAELENDGMNADIWTNGDSSYIGAAFWAGVTSALAQTSGTTWHLGAGSGATAKVITVSITTEATGTNCIYQGYAQVMTG